MCVSLCCHEEIDGREVYQTHAAIKLWTRVVGLAAGRWMMLNQKRFMSTDETRSKEKTAERMTSKSYRKCSFGFWQIS
jgi:hypothetical protein